MGKKRTSPKQASRAKKSKATPRESSKKAAKSRKGGAVAAKKTAGKTAAKTVRKTAKHVDALRAMSRAERAAFLEESSLPELLRIFESSYDADLVNVLLDLKKSTVKNLFESLVTVRKRAVACVATLYYYNEYLTNPLPLRVVTESGDTVPNYYAILGVPRDATDEELRGAFRLLARAHAPECFSPSMRKSGEERLEEIREAFKQLKAPQRRSRADRLLPNVSYLYPRRDQSWFDSVQKLLD